VIKHALYYYLLLTGSHLTWYLFLAMKRRIAALQAIGAAQITAWRLEQAARITKQTALNALPPFQVVHRRDQRSDFSSLNSHKAIRRAL
jgi:hypothetical protein